MFTLYSDQMNGTSWGCEGVFLWCYGSLRMFVMWQEVVNVWGWRVLSDDGSWRNHVWAESGRGVGEEEIKKKAKERKRGAFTQQTGLPSPFSYPCICPPTVGNIDLRGTVNGSGIESICCDATRELNFSILQALRTCHSLGALSHSLCSLLDLAGSNRCNLSLVFSLFISLSALEHLTGSLVSSGKNTCNADDPLYLEVCWLSKDISLALMSVFSFFAILLGYIKQRDS